MEHKLLLLFGFGIACNALCKLLCTWNFFDSLIEYYEFDFALIAASLVLTRPIPKLC
jgi:hypothetical protein